MSVWNYWVKSTLYRLNTSVNRSRVQGIISILVALSIKLPSSPRCYSLMYFNISLLLHCNVKYWPSNKIFLFYLNSEHKIIHVKPQLIDWIIIFLNWYYFELLFSWVWYEISDKNKCHHCKYTNRCTTPKNWLIIWLTIDTQENQLSKYI